MRHPASRPLRNDTSKDMDATAHTAYIALGGNLGDAAATVRRAFAALAALP